MEVPFHAELRPVPEFLIEVRTRSFRLQPERMPAQVNALISASCPGKAETLAEVCQGIASIHCRCESIATLKRCAGHEASSRGVRSPRINIAALLHSRPSMLSIESHSSVRMRSCICPRFKAVAY